jgi:hypothetical protein
LHLIDLQLIVLTFGFDMCYILYYRLLWLGFRLSLRFLIEKSPGHTSIHVLLLGFSLLFLGG